MKTFRNVQIAITVVAILTAVSLADNMNPTTGELVASVMLSLTSGVSLLTLVHNSENPAEVE